MPSRQIQLGRTRRPLQVSTIKRRSTKPALCATPPSMVRTRTDSCSSHEGGSDAIDDEYAELPVAWTEALDAHPSDSRLSPPLTTSCEGATRRRAQRRRS